MRDFEPIVPQQDNKTIAAEQRQVKTEQQINSLSIHPGHTVFEFSVATGDITPAKIERIDVKVNVNGKANQVHKKIIQKPQHLYCSALNVPNAIKKFAKMYQRLVNAGHIIRPNQQQNDLGK